MASSLRRFFSMACNQAAIHPLRWAHIAALASRKVNRRRSNDTNTYFYRKFGCAVLLTSSIHIEVRKKIIEARKSGMLIREISRAYMVSVNAVNCLLRMERETGDITPKTHLRGRKPALNSQQLEQMRELIISEPDITLEEIRENMSLTIKKSAISKIINEKLGFRYKKRQYIQVKGIVQML